MNKRIWMYILLIFVTLSVWFWFTVGLILFIFILLFMYEPDMQYFNLHRYIIEAIILTAIYIYGAFAGIGSLLALGRIYENKRLKIIHKIALGSYIIILLTLIVTQIKH